LGAHAWQFDDRRARRALVDLAHVEHTVLADDVREGWAICGRRERNVWNVFTIEGRKLALRYRWV
jgi:hypothetical protein